MKRAYLTSLLLLLAVASATAEAATAAPTCGCSAQSPPFPPGELSPDQFTPGTDRRYRVHLPASYRPGTAHPVIFSYHGAGGTIEKQAALDGFAEPFRNDRYVVVYLQAATTTTTAAGGGKAEWQVAPGARDVDDLGFTRDVLDDLQARLCLDARRVYAAGKSQGGGFVGQKLACDPALAARFAAFAPVSGPYYVLDQTEGDCDPPAAVSIPCAATRTDTPVLAFHGGADETIPYRGKYRAGTKSCLPDIRHWTRQWVKRDGLTGSETNTTIPGSESGVTSSWADRRVELVYDGDDIPHDWPSTVTNSDNKGSPVAAFNATDHILEWFALWSLSA